jgi:hypothetical protein
VIITAGGPQGGPPAGCSYYSAGGYSTNSTIFETLLPGESRTLAVRYFYDGPKTGNCYDEWIESWSAGPAGGPRRIVP